MASLFRKTERGDRVCGNWGARCYTGRRTLGTSVGKETQRSDISVDPASLSSREAESTGFQYEVSIDRWTLNARKLSSTWTPELNFRPENGRLCSVHRVARSTCQLDSAVQR